MIQNSRVEVLETIGLELMVYLNMLFVEWMKQVPALESLVPVNENHEYFTAAMFKIHESEKSEHLYFNGPLAGFQISVELNDDSQPTLYVLRHEQAEKMFTYRVTDMICLAKKMAALAFGHAGTAFVDCETRVFHPTGPATV